MSRHWKVAIVKDSSKPMLGLHGLHTAFRGLPNVEVVALVDANLDQLVRKMEQTQAKRHYKSIESLLEVESPDIVVLSSRHPEDHLEQIRKVVQKGCHIYCEKPVSVLLEEADEIVRLVEATSVKLAMAHPARHDLAFRNMKQLLEAGEIGTPLSAIGRGKCDHRGGGEDLIVLGTHILDLMVFLFGSPESVMARVSVGGRRAALSDKEETVEPVGPALGDEVFASFMFPCGVSGLFESRRGLLKPNQSAPHMGLCVMGTKGTLSLRFDDGGTQPLLISRQTGFPETITDFEQVPVTEGRTVPGAEPLDYRLCSQSDVPRARWFMESNRFAAWDLMQAIEEDRPPLSNIGNARTVVEMIQGIYAAHLSRRTVDFPLACRRHPLVQEPDL